MNTDEQSLIDGLFTRLQQAEKEGSARDAQADERIKGHVSAQPAAPYYMAQAILVQEAAIKRLSEQNQQLQTELQQARSQAAAPAQQGGGVFCRVFSAAATATCSNRRGPCNLRATAGANRLVRRRRTSRRHSRTTPLQALRRRRVAASCAAPCRRLPVWPGA